MNILKEFFSRIFWWYKADRLGPDMLSTHYMLYYPILSRKVCKKKFKKFDTSAEFRPGAYAVNCSQISLGKNVVIRPTTMLFATSDTSIEIEDNVLIGSGTHIYVTNHEFRKSNIDIIEQGHSEGKRVLLRKGCWIGANVIILPGVTIGENAVVGAGSLVTKDVPSRCVAVGNPARVIRELE